MSATRRKACRHPIFHILVVTEGSGSFLLDGQSMTLAAPHLVLVSPGEAHCLCCAPDESVHYSALSFWFPGSGELPDWSGLLSRYIGQACSLPLHVAIDRSLTAQLRDPIESCLRLEVDDAQRPWLLQTYLCEIFLLLYRHLVAAKQEARQPEPAELARRYIDEYAVSPLTLAAVADAVGLSSSQLGRLFRDRFGLPPMQYRRQLLIERACELLEGSEMSVAEVARNLGFDDVGYFNRCFRQLRGMAPGRYRRSRGGPLIAQDERAGA